MNVIASDPTHSGFSFLPGDRFCEKQDLRRQNGFEQCPFGFGGHALPSIGCVATPMIAAAGMGVNALRSAAAPVCGRAA